MTESQKAQWKDFRCWAGKRKGVKKGDSQSLMGIRDLKMRVYSGFLWQLKSTGIKGILRLILMKVFDKSFKFRIAALMTQMCNLSACSRTNLGSDYSWVKYLLAKCLPLKGIGWYMWLWRDLKTLKVIKAYYSLPSIYIIWQLLLLYERLSLS